MIITFLMVFVLPFSLPLIPGIRTNSYLQKRTEQPPIARVYTAGKADITERAKLIEAWDAQNARSAATGARPSMLEVGQKFEKQFKNPSKSIFWSDDIQPHRQSNRVRGPWKSQG